MHMLTTLALTLHQSVCKDPQATWETLTQEDRQTALQWARDATTKLMEMARYIEHHGAELFLEAVRSDEPGAG